MKKNLSSILGIRAISFLSALFIASIIFALFISGQKDKKIATPIFSKSPHDKTGRVFSKVSYKNKRPEYVEGQVIVKYKKDDLRIKESEGRDKAKEIRASNSVKKLRSMERLNTELVEITDGSSVKDKVQELKKDNRVENAEPNYLYYSTFTPDDAGFGIQWALQNSGQEVDGVTGTSDADMDVAEMWDIETDHTEDIIVAVLDSGVALNHPDISSNLVTGYDALSGGVLEPYDNQGHGSHVAGIIASLVNNTAGMSGISMFNNVKIMPLRASLGGSFRLSEILDSIDYATNNGADIINMSLSGEGFSQEWEDALADFPGLVVAAAGNGGDDGLSDDNDDTPQYPASFDLPNIISVAATDQNDKLADFSNYGADSVDVGAPGVNIYSLWPYNVFEEDFESVVEPDIGTQLSQSGVGTNWGTAYAEGFGTALLSDIDFLSSGSYAANADSYITSSSVNIASSSQPFLQFYYECYLPAVTGPSTDYLGVEVYDGVDWTEIAIINTEEQGNFYADVSSYVSSEFRVRLHWYTDASDNNYFGCIIDDIEIVDPSSTEGSYAYADGTSMACPYTTALAAMVWGKNPTISVARLKSMILETGDSVEDLSGITVTGRRINAYTAYNADPEDFEDYEDPVPEPPSPSTGVVFHPDTRCHWKKPGTPTWIKLEKTTEGGVSGMKLTWTQYDADKIDIKIDDGTGNYPWKISKTANDGHEFLANVFPWQNIMVKPTNHCKEGEYSQPVSYSAYPYGWYSVKPSTTLASSSLKTTSASTGTSTANGVLGTATEMPAEETPMVPNTGSNDLIFITTSLSLIGFATYFVLNEKTRKIALRGFEKKASKGK